MTSDHAFSRRLFLNGAVAGAAAFGGFGALFAADNAEKAKKRQKRAVLVFMSGGPSQFETWDPKPGARTAGPHLTIPTALAGVRFDEFLPNLARLAGRMAVIRSMSTPSNDHVGGGLHTQSGHFPSPAIAPPPHWMAFGSRLLPGDGELPSYVQLGDDGKTFPTPGAGFLGSGHAPLLCAGGGKLPEDLPPPGEASAQDRREALRGKLGAGFAAGRPAHLVEAHDMAFRRMSALMRRQSALDISKEPAKTQERYGESRLGKDLLLARRLLEAGVPFVRVQHQNGGAWDKHRNAFRSQRHINAEFDAAVSALVDDLIERGLYDSTLVVLMGEFGRTPMINGQGGGGRDHWSKSWSLSLGGCGIKGGVVVGSTNADGTAVKDRPVSVPDLFCTFYKALGLDPHKEVYYRKQPIPLVESKLGKPIAELI